MGSTAAVVRHQTVWLSGAQGNRCDGDGHAQRRETGGDVKRTRAPLLLQLSKRASSSLSDVFIQRPSLPRVV